MATKEALLLYLSSIDKKNYYEILRVSPDAPPEGIKRAFHSFSLLYHPDLFVDSPKEVGAVASEIYKRAVEAYRCLSRRAERDRYDRAVARGKIRIEPWIPSTRPPPPPVRTLETIARTARAKTFATKAERLIAIGRLAEARLELVTACQSDPGNDELEERLRFLYEAIALEPP